MSMPLPRVISLMGPTASGKTDLAIKLCQSLNAEIISVDSALVYCELNIGAAKPTPEEQQLAPHRLIDIRSITEPYSAADFCQDAARHIEDILNNGKTPLLVGGTMMYFKALLEGMSPMPEADESVRAEIEKDAQEHGWPYVHQQLAEVDPVSAEKIHPNHSQRIERALEVFRLTGKPMSSFHAQDDLGLESSYDWKQFALIPSDRSVLHQRINHRFDLMLENGLVDEVRALMGIEGVHKDLPAIRAVGYRQVWEYLSGEYDEQTMVDKGKAATRQLAKRQLTWLRSWPGVIEVNSLDSSGKNYPSERLARSILQILEKQAI